MKSQSAIEFMSVIMIGLVLIAVASYFGVDYITSYFGDMNIINAKQTVDTIVSSTNLVYAQGVDAQTQIFVTIPSGIVRSKTYVYGDEIHIRFKNGNIKDFYKNTRVDVFGSLPLNPGKVSLKIRMTEDGAFLFIADHDISLVYVRTFNTSSHTDYVDNFSVGDTAYFGVALMDINNNYKNSVVNLIIYRPNGTILAEENVTVNGIFYSDFVVDEVGTWLISAMIPETKVIGTALVKVS